MFIGVLAALLLLCWLKKRKVVPEESFCTGIREHPAVWSPNTPKSIALKVQKSKEIVDAAYRIESVIKKACGSEELPSSNLDRTTTLLTALGILSGMEPADAADKAADHATMVIYAGPLRVSAVSSAATRAVRFLDDVSFDEDVAGVCRAAVVMSSSS